MTLPPRGPRAGPPWAEILARLRRIESRLVQLMKHEGMKSDGRAALPTEHKLTELENHDEEIR